jgi:hypothetical protein
MGRQQGEIMAAIGKAGLSAASCAIAVIAAVLAVSVGAQTKTWQGPHGNTNVKPAAVDVCSLMPGLSTGGLVTGNTNGDFGTLAAGESVTMTATLGTATGGTFRIVGDPSGTNTLAGPSGIPGSLTFTSNGTLPGTSVGVGYFIDSAVGGTVNISVTSVCGGSANIPTTSQSNLLVLAALLAICGAAVLIRRRG